MKFEISELRSSTVWNVYRMRDRIQLNPHYQWMSDIWTLDKRQLPIDTILNNFDISQLYRHKFYKPLKKKEEKHSITPAISKLCPLFIPCQKQTCDRPRGGSYRI